MKTIKRIAGAEFRMLFYSPIAWIVMIIFIISSSIDFSDHLEIWMQRQETIGNALARMFGGLSSIIYGTSRHGIFIQTQQNLYLYVPLLTMGLLSRELSSGSIKLLYSSPIRISQIVLGKFGAMMLYCLLFVGVMAIYCLMGNVMVKNLDFVSLIPPLVATYLVVLTYSAIGLFMSSLTPYQVVAALSTLAVLAFMNYVGEIGQEFAFMRALTDFLSVRGRASDNMNQALIRSADILYFLLIIGLFLTITIMRLNDGRRLRPRLVMISRYVGLSVVFLLVGYISNRHSVTAYYDMTRYKTQTISVNSQKVLEKIKGPLTVTAWDNLLGIGDELGLPQNRNEDYHFWEKYVRFKGDMDFKYNIYYDTSFHYIFRTKQNAGKPVSVLGPQMIDANSLSMSEVMTPEQERQAIDLELEEHRFVRQLEAAGKKSFVRVFDENPMIPFEHEVIASMRRLTDTPPKIVFAGGDYERSIIHRDPVEYYAICAMPGFRKALINQGFDFDTVFLDRQDVPRDIAALVVSDPKRPLSAVEMTRLNQYISAGGNMIIAGEPTRQALLNPLLASVGVRLQDGVMISPGKYNGPTTIKGLFSGQVGEVFDQEKFRDFLNPDSLKKLYLSGAVGLEYKKDGPFKVTPLIVSDPRNTWNKAGNYELDTIPKTYDSAAGDRKAQVPFGLALTRQVGGREQRIIVLGDADMLSAVCAFNEGNPGFLTELFKWLNYGLFPVETDALPTNDYDFSATLSSIPAVKTTFFVVIPGILLAACMVLLIRRRRK
ncbi:MAG: Gldg family protein [Bacteroidota bacterium]|nr:Gldg family protein [Bacteroidota bacterium]